MKAGDRYYGAIARKYDARRQHKKLWSRVPSLYSVLIIKAVRA